MLSRSVWAIPDPDPVVVSDSRGPSGPLRRGERRVSSSSEQAAGLPVSQLPFSNFPVAQGLYDPRNEADSCGVAFLADLKGRRTHDLVRNALIALHNMD